MKNFNKKLEALMAQKGLTQLALSSQLGIAQTAISQWLRGVNEPSRRSLKKVADFFNVSVEMLINDNVELDLKNLPDIPKITKANVSKMEEDLKRIIVLRDNLNSTIDEIYNLLSRQITEINKF